MLINSPLRYISHACWVDMVTQCHCDKAEIENGSIITSTPIILLKE